MDAVEKKLLELEASFIEGRKRFPADRRPRADLSCLPGREQFGIWRLSPSNEDTLASWVDFNYLAASAVEVLGLKPIPHPNAIEFDPDWVREEVPSGLNAVNEVTRAWLHFLRLESLKHKRIAVEDWEPFENIWDASAVQCKRSALEKKISILTTPVTLSPLVQEWEAVKSIKQLMTGPREQVPEAFVRHSLASQWGVPPESVTSSQILDGVLDLTRHYNVVTLLRSDSETKLNTIHMPDVQTSSESDVQRESSPGTGKAVVEGDETCASANEFIGAHPRSNLPNTERHHNESSGFQTAASHGQDFGFPQSSIGRPEALQDKPQPDLLSKVPPKAADRVSRIGDAALLHGKSEVTFSIAETYLGIGKRQRQSLISSDILKTTGQGHHIRVTTASLLNYLPPRPKE